MVRPDDLNDEDRTRRELILATVRDFVSDFLYYDRKEDECLPRNAIEEAIEAGEITVNEIVKEFKDELKKYL